MSPGDDHRSVVRVADDDPHVTAAALARGKPFGKFSAAMSKYRLDRFRCEACIETDPAPRLIQ
jgi:hypothetical protein